MPELFINIFALACPPPGHSPHRRGPLLTGANHHRDSVILIIISTFLPGSAIMFKLLLNISNRSYVPLFRVRSGSYLKDFEILKDFF